jgi:hypothetical protein
MDQADCDLTKHMEYIMCQNCIKEDGQDFVRLSQDLVYTARHLAQLLAMLHQRVFARGDFYPKNILMRLVQWQFSQGGEGKDMGEDGRFYQLLLTDGGASFKEGVEYIRSRDEGLSAAQTMA